MFDQPSIEKLKHEFTDKYVVVDGGRPELARFNGLTGQIKTVNMSGKALVQFDGRLNIGWYDIGLDFLKIVPKPEPKVEDERHAKKAAPAAKADAPKPAAAAPAAGVKKPSVLDQLKAQGAAKAAVRLPRRLNLLRRLRRRKLPLPHRSPKRRRNRNRPQPHPPARRNSRPPTSWRR